jgi:hypothetical protein
MIDQFQRRAGASAWTLTLLLISIAVLFAAGPASAMYWYVDTNMAGASDSNDGSPGHPFKTIQRGINRASNGDIVFVRAGTYYGGVTLNKGITLKGLPGAKITTTDTGDGVGINIWADNCSIEGFRIEYFAMAIAAFDEPHANVRVIGNYTYACQFHCWINGTDWVVQNNEFERCVWWARVGDTDYTRMFGTGHVFRGNYCHGTIYPDDIRPLSGTDYAHNDGIQYYGNNGDVIQNVTVEENFFTDFHQGIFWADEQNTTSIKNVMIRNNIFWGQTYTAPIGTNLLGLPSWGVLVGKNYGATNVHVENNLFYHIANYMGLRGYNTAVARNNIVVGAGAGTLYVLDGNTTSNITPGNTFWQIATRGDLNSGLDVNMNPFLQDPSRPLGADGILWTADDGWRPTASSVSNLGPTMFAPARVDDQSIWIDTDNDGVYDLTEIQLGTDPNNPNDFPILPMSSATVLGASLLLAGFGAWHVQRTRRSR